jgi:hypothetical protein
VVECFILASNPGIIDKQYAIYRLSASANLKEIVGWGKDGGCIHSRMDGPCF